MGVANSMQKLKMDILKKNALKGTKLSSV